MDEYNNFRSCIIREKKIFRSIVGDDKVKNAQTITDYLEKHFKEKDAKKKQRQMMGADADELYKNKIQKMEEETSQIVRKRIDTMDFKKQRELMTMGAGGNSQEEEKYI